MRMSGVVSSLPRWAPAHRPVACQRGLARAVGAEQRDARTGAQHQFDVLEQLLVTVGETHLLRAQQQVRAALRRLDLQFEVAVGDVGRCDAGEFAPAP